MQGYRSCIFFCNNLRNLRHKIQKGNAMNKKRITIITDVILLAVFVFVTGVSFFSERILPISIYDGDKVSAIYRGNTEKNNVSLMFNVYENTSIVNQIVKTLKDNGVVATFFVGGCWADDNIETLKSILDGGNELANHGYFHKDHAVISNEKNREEIYNNGVLIKSLVGVDMTLFAPPSGSYKEDTLKIANELGYKVIMWSKDTIDWRDKNEDVVYSRATKNAGNGDLILMHPKAHTLNVLGEIIDFYKSNGYNLVTVSENIGV